MQSANLDISTASIRPVLNMISNCKKQNGVAVLSVAEGSFFLSFWKRFLKRDRIPLI